MTIEIDRLPDNAGAADAIRWMRHITKTIGPGFHPDTPAEDYVTDDDGIRTFRDEQTQRINNDLNRAFDLLKAVGRDPYAVAHRVQRRLLGMPPPEYPESSSGSSLG